MSILFTVKSTWSDEETLASHVAFYALSVGTMKGIEKLRKLVKSRNVTKLDAIVRCDIHPSHISDGQTE